MEEKRKREHSSKENKVNLDSYKTKPFQLKYHKNNPKKRKGKKKGNYNYQIAFNEKIKLDLIYLINNKKNKI